MKQQGGLSDQAKSSVQERRKKKRIAKNRISSTETAEDVSKKRSHINHLQDKWVTCRVLISLWGTNQDKDSKNRRHVVRVNYGNQEKISRGPKEKRNGYANTSTCTKKVYARSGCSFGFCGRALLRH